MAANVANEMHADCNACWHQQGSKCWKRSLRQQLERQRAEYEVAKDVGNDDDTTMTYDSCWWTFVFSHLRFELLQVLWLAVRVLDILGNSPQIPHNSSTKVSTK